MVLPRDESDETRRDEPHSSYYNHDQNYERRDVPDTGLTNLGDFFYEANEDSTRTDQSSTETIDITEREVLEDNTTDPKKFPIQCTDLFTDIGMGDMNLLQITVEAKRGVMVTSHDNLPMSVLERSGIVYPTANSNCNLSNEDNLTVSSREADHDI